jgi:hypothetical protein
MPVRTPVNVQLSSSYSLAPSTLEDVDYALYNYINDGLNIFTDTNKGFEKVPIIYSIPERAYQIKNDPNLREGGRTLIYPLISILRDGMVKNPQNKGKYGVYVPPYFDYYDRGGAIPLVRAVQQDKTKNFANANAVRGHMSGTGVNKNYQTFPIKNKNIVYETLMIPIPTFVELTYRVGIITEYQQQMNEIVAPFLAKTSTPSAFKIKHEGNSYEAFIEPDFSFENNSAALDVDERIFKTNVTIKVLGYLIGSGKNENTPVPVARQSAAKIRIQRERVVVGDEIPWNSNSKDKYRS